MGDRADALEFRPCLPQAGHAVDGAVEGLKVQDSSSAIEPSTLTFEDSTPQPSNLDTVVKFLATLDVYVSQHRVTWFYRPA